MVDYIAVSCAVGVASLTIAKSRFFQWLRQLAPGILKELISCPYCLSHWLAAVAQLVFQFSFTTSYSWLIAWLTLVAVSNLVIVVIYQGHRIGDK